MKKTRSDFHVFFFFENTVGQVWARLKKKYFRRKTTLKIVGIIYSGLVALPVLLGNLKYIFVTMLSLDSNVHNL